jgi:hypothetical protein
MAVADVFRDVLATASAIAGLLEMSTPRYSNAVRKTFFVH